MAPTKTNQLNNSKAKELREKKAAFKLLNTILAKTKNLDSPEVQSMIKYRNQLGKETGLGLPIEDQVHNFLVRNGLPTFVFPKIQTLGKYKGGYSLVRSIATEYGGMKNVKVLYAKKYNLDITGKTFEQIMFENGLLPCWDEEELIA